MYIVTARDKQRDIDSRQKFDSYNAAMECLNKYRNDTSNLYSNVSILDAKTNYILAIILFDKSGNMTAEFHEHSIVKIKPEWWASPTEADDCYWITDIHDEYERCTANYIDVNHKFAIGSSQTFSLEWIEVVQL